MDNENLRETQWHTEHMAPPAIAMIISSWFVVVVHVDG